MQAHLAMACLVPLLGSLAVLSHVALAAVVKLMSCLVAEVVPSEDPSDASVGAKLGLISLSRLLIVGGEFSQLAKNVSPSFAN